jgi:hypothetical protein
MSVDEAVLFGQSLPELLEGARSANQHDRIQLYRDAIAQHGSDAIEAVEPWLTDPHLNWFAAVVIRRVADYGGKRSAIDALRRARDAAPESFVDFLESLLRSLGAPTVELRDYPRGTQVLPIGSGASVHHAVVDYVPSTKTKWGDVYLAECGWFFSGEWTRISGGLVARVTGPICVKCSQALEHEGPQR